MEKQFNRIRLFFKSRYGINMTDAEILEVKNSLISLAKARVRYELILRGKVTPQKNNGSLVTPVIGNKVVTSMPDQKNQHLAKKQRLDCRTFSSGVSKDGDL